MARAVSDKVRAQHSLLDQARQTLARWKRTRTSWPRDLVEWERILEGTPVDDVLRALLEESDEGARRRQSSPFTGILTAAERSAILARYEEIGD